MKKLLAVIAAFFLSLSCMLGKSIPVPFSAPSPTLTSTLTPSPTVTDTPFPTLTPSPTLTRTPSATPDPYLTYTIDYLRSRSYGGGSLEMVQPMGDFGSFTRYAVRYTSDGLNIYAIVSLPVGDGPFPVIILLHGYDWPVNYNLFNEALDTDDGFAGAGYFVLRPAMRNYAPSDLGDNRFRVGMAIDVLNLIALIKAQAGQLGPLEKADAERIGLWGYSMGGGVALRVLTVTSDVDAAMLYSPISGDESKDRVLFAGLADGQDPQFNGEAGVPEADLTRISPSYYYSSISSPLLIFHGTADTLVPVNWTVETCDLLSELGKNPDCIFYDGGAHSFVSRYLDDMIPRMYEFFDQYLRQ